MNGKGADITPVASYLVEVSHAGGAYTIERAAILGGYEHNVTKLATDASHSPLAESSKDLNPSLRKRNLLASIPSHEVMTRVTDIANTSPGAIAALARMEVRETTGKESGFVTGTQVFSNNYAGNTQLMIAMAREAVVEHYSTALTNTKLRIDGIVPSAVALYHAHLVSGDFEAPGIQMIANIGEVSTDFIVVDGGDLLASRTISYGLSDFISAIATGLGVNREQARQVALSSINIRPGHAADNASGEGVVRHAQDAAARLYSQLKAAEGYVKAVTGKLNLKIDILALCGPGALIGGLPEFIAHRAQTKVTIFNPLSGFELGSMGGNQRAIVGQHSVAMAIALGLAKIAADDGRNATVLIPPSVQARNTFLQRSIWLNAAVLLTVLVLSASFFLSLKSVNQAEDLLTNTSTGLQTQEGVYGSAHRRITEAKSTPDPYGQSDLRMDFNALSELQRDLVNVEGQLRETLSLTASLTAARHVMAELPMLLESTGASLESFSAQLEQRTGKMVPVARFQVSIRNKSDISEQVQAIKEKVRAHPKVASVTNSAGSESSDRSASSAHFVVLFNPVEAAVLKTTQDESEVSE